MPEIRRNRRRSGGTAVSPSPLSPASAPHLAATSLLLLGLLIGLVGSLTYAWVFAPVVYTDAAPSRLSAAAKAEYIVLISDSYAANGRWEQAEARLAALDDPALPQTVSDLLEQSLRAQRPPAEIRRLAALAQQLGIQSRAVALFAPTPLAGTAVAPLETHTPTPTVTATPNRPRPTPSATPTQTPSPTPFPTFPPSPTVQPDYRLLNQERLCDPAAPAPRLEIITYDALLNELPGIEVLISWSEGSDHLFTGFKPALGQGYGDFTMQPGISYSVRLAEGSPEVSGLRIETCASGLVGGWRLAFQNLRLVLTPVGDDN